jgi:hypothetical protein
LSDDPLDQINRAVIAVAALVLIFLAAVVVLFAWAEPGAGVGVVDDFAGWLGDVQDDRDAKIVLTLGAIIVILLLLSLIILQLTPSPAQKMRVRTVKFGDGTITTPEIAARVEAEARAVPHVIDCTAIVAARGRKLEVVLDLHVDDRADLARTADEACQRTHLLIEDRMDIGLVKKPRARLHYRELRLKDGPPTGAVARAAPARAATGWERPEDEGAHDQRGSTGTSEEAQA